MNEKVSIITPMFNSSKYLEEAVCSVMKQSHTNWELLLVDDCSTDNTLEIALNFAKKEPRIRVIRNSTNLGIAAARNEGVCYSTGDWIAFLDSDDVWLAHKLEQQLKCVEETGGDFIYGSYRNISESGELQNLIKCSKQISYLTLLKGSEIGCLTVLVKSKVLKKYKFQNVFHEDYLLWLNLLKNESISAFAVQEEIALYRKRHNSRSANKILCAFYQWAIYRKHLNLSMSKSILSMMMYSFNGLKKHYRFY